MEQESLSPEIPDELIEEWTTRWGSVYYLKLLHQLYIFRRLTRREYRAVLITEDPEERNDAIAERCVLWPVSYQVDPEGPAGIPSALTEHILNASGCGPHMKDHFQKLAEHITNDIEAQMETLVEHVFGGGGNFQRYQDWSHTQLFEAYYRAQWLLSQQGLPSPQTVSINGQNVNVNELSPKQRQQIMARQRVAQRREKGADAEGTPMSAEPNLAQQIRQYEGGPAALQPMSEAIKKNLKFHAQQELRKHG